ncbi:tail spike protein [Klebsiella phage vB_Kpn_K22PH164C1]|uniref:Tail spike protein n=1 Tax=Klebsiella phage vB_Kpn_K22PH164C1 TaxID=3071617 RepID=A0AAV1MIF0_9CAUD|nr:tail spike protein [Klebsiella phage vB_Kpn_K22PH164C1]
MIQQLSAAFVRIKQGITLHQWLSYNRGKRANVLDFMSAEEREDVLNFTGTRDNSEAFRQALATGCKIIDVPAGLYHVGEVTIPNKVRLFGEWAYRPYNMASDASFDKDGTMIKKVSGAPSMFLWGTACGADQIMFDGVDRTASAIHSKTDGKITVAFYRCGFYRWARVGNRNGAYLACSMHFCNINQNNVGLYNTVDGNHIGLTINANRSDGVRLETGADSNTFTNCRNEWNEGNNWNFYGCVSIQVIGEVTDRAFKYGFRISNSNVQLLNVGIRRSGRTADSTATSAQIFIENSRVRLIGVKTSAGADDAGGSITEPSPAFTFRFEGGNEGILEMTSCKLDGNTTSTISGSARPAQMRISDCAGWDDYCNVGLYRKSNGKIYNDYVITSGAAGVSALTLSFSKGPVSTNSNATIMVELLWRNTDTGGSNVAWLYIGFARASGSATAFIAKVISRDDTVGLTDVDSSPAPGQNYTVAINVTSADASTFDITFKAKSTVTTNFSLRGYVKA